MAVLLGGTVGHLAGDSALVGDRICVQFFGAVMTEWDRFRRDYMWLAEYKNMLNGGYRREWL